ncbi:ATP-binding cassette domain-containing protein, partial [uncultured Alistipes sp.]|uniref:ATP-binding cassette domain-containing protein n=1 Tax=uncultured Alistipes sp. TaxID=538949 RepID=UPI0026066AB0
GGCTLSGGEKQRVSIARAMLKDAQIILLDEATASLDPENEVEVQKAIDALIKGHTVIAIAHRLKTIKGADQIIVLDNGQIKEKGTHETLMQAEGLYAQLWNIQEQISGWKL